MHTKFSIGFVLFTALTITSAQAFSGEGTGSDQNPYQVTTCDQLDEIRNSYSQSYELKNNIDCGIAPYNTGLGFEPLGVQGGSYFNGTLEGNGFTISNLYMNRPNEDRIGLLGYTDGGKVKNLKIVGANITGKRYVGIVAGHMQGSSTIENTYVTGTVTGTYNTGGLVGWNIGDISNSYANATVNGATYTGGLVGGNNKKIENAYAKGSVNGSDTLGGLVGISTGGGASIKKSYATGSVTGGSMVGGLVGRNTSGALIQHSYSTGTVSGSSVVGGLVGGSSGSTVSNSYWDVSRSGQTTSPSGVPINTSGDPDPNYWFNNSANSPMNSWNFTSTWQALAGSYPSLKTITNPVIASGSGFVQSGIDLDASTLVLQFQPELPGVTPVFSCLGQAPVLDSDPSYESRISLSLNAAGITNVSNLQRVLTNECFQQAGDYKLTITLFDKANNSKNNFFIISWC